MIQKDNVQFRGIPFEYGDEILVVPALPLGIAKEMQKKYNAFMKDKENLPTEEATDAVVEFYSEAAFAALRRNYQDITKEQVFDFVTTENSVDVFRAAVFGNAPASEKVKTPGEAKAVLETKRQAPAPTK